MARYASFGEALKEARIRKGIDAYAAAKRLRIRTDILRAIEESDFAALPAKGYCKNMIFAYARMVGLNGEEIVNQYLEEVYSFEVGRVRESSRYEPRSARSRETLQYEPRSARGHEAPRNRNVPARESRNGRVRVSDDRYSRDRSSDTRGKNAGSELAFPGTSRSANLNQGASRRPRQTRSSLPTPSTHYSSMGSSPKKNGEPSKIPFLAAGVAVLIVLALIAALVFGGKKDESTEDLPDVPISGLTDTSTPADPEADASVPTPPTSAEFGYKVPEGQSAYIEVYVDGADSPSEAATVEGSASKRYEVTGTLKFVTTNPTGVSITVDGETVSPTDDDGNGVYVYTVDFASILAAWNEANQPEPETSSDSDDATADEGSGE